MPLEDLNLFKTGYLHLDNAIKGIALGKFTVVAGLEGTGKTTLCLNILNKFKKTYPDSYIRIYDTENTLSKTRFQEVNADDKDFEFPDESFVYSIENVFKDIEERTIEIRKKQAGHILILIDSLANLSPEAELKGEVGDSDFGLRAKLVGQGLRKNTMFYKDQDVTVIATNQLRMIMNAMPFSDPYTSPCGKAPYYAAFLHLILKKKNPPWDESNYFVKAKVLKNKAGSPKDFTYVMNYVNGYNEELSTLHYLLENKDAINSRGTYEISKIGFKGREDSFIKEYPQLKDKIFEKFYSEEKESK